MSQNGKTFFAHMYRITTPGKQINKVLLAKRNRAKICVSVCHILHTYMEIVKSFAIKLSNKMLWPTKGYLVNCRICEKLN